MKKKCLNCGKMFSHFPSAKRVYCSYKCSSDYKVGNNNPNWRGGRLKKKNGYIIVFSPHHPFASKDKYVLEHRLIVEKNIGRFLNPKEVVHHINGVVDDNRIENLELFLSQADHARVEYRTTVRINKKGQIKKGRIKNGKIPG